MTRLKVDWICKNTTDVDPTIRRFERWLVEMVIEKPASKLIPVLSGSS